jgi:hypothetical protein
MRDKHAQTTGEHNMNNINITVGTPVTYSNGRDSYPYYVVEVSADQKKVALACAEYQIADYYDGHGMVKPFNPNAAPCEYLAKYGKHWYGARKDENGNIVRIPGARSKYGHYTFGVAVFYQDPHF